VSGVEHRTAVERGQMGHELSRGLALVAGEPFQASEEVLIRQCGGGYEDVGEPAVQPERSGGRRDPRAAEASRSLPNERFQESEAGAVHSSFTSPCSRRSPGRW
jgi:hypothetical protein